MRVYHSYKTKEKKGQLVHPWPEPCMYIGVKTSVHECGSYYSCMHCFSMHVGVKTTENVFTTVVCALACM